MKTLILLPTYNEVENLPKMIDALMALPLDLQVMIIDDASPDGTGEAAEVLKAKYAGRILVEHRSGKNGLGTAYIMGFEKALAMPEIEVIGQKWIATFRMTRKWCRHWWLLCKTKM